MCEAWIPTRLGEFVRIKHGWPFKSEHFSEVLTGRPIVVAVGNFRYEGGFRFAETATKEYLDAYPDEYELSPGEILLVMTCQTQGGEILGIPARIPDDGRTFLHNQRLGKAVNIARDTIDDGFLYYLFTSRQFNAELCATASGSKILHTAPARIEAFEFLRPNIGEQRAIAGVLGSLDDKIEQNRLTSQALERLGRAIFRAWFVDFEPVHAKAAGATSFPSMPNDIFDSLPTTFTPSNLGPIPEGWAVDTLGQNCEINARTIRKGEIEGDIEYIDISAVTTGHLEATQRFAFRDAPSRARRRVRHGDTIWSCVRPNRRSYLFLHSPPANRIVSTGFAVLSPKQFGSSFLYQTTTQSEFVDYLVANADGSAYPAVRPEHFAAATMISPPDVVLKEYEQLTMPFRDLIHAADIESRKLAELRDYLLPKLLSGDVRVRDAERLAESVA